MGINLSGLKQVYKMFDVHCHVDLYPNPLLIANECESLGINTIAMTNLPSHFKLGYNNLLPFKKIRLALGMHPLYANRHPEEFPLFRELISKTSYIGEIGLDFSKEGIATKSIQLSTFENILFELKGQKKILSLHSRNAESETLNLLLKYDIKSAIFHWYTGGLNLISEIAKAGYYFSINPAMIKSNRGQEIIKKIPSQNILTESDGPFIEHKGRSVKPSDLGVITSFLSLLWNMSVDDTQKLIDSNFKRLISSLSK